MPSPRSVLVVGPMSGALAIEAALEGQPYALLRQDEQRALDVLEERSVDVVLLDLGTLEASLTLARAIEKRWPGLPMIVLTAETAAEELREVLAFGATDVVLRPFDGRQLAFAVGKALAMAERSAAQPPPPRTETGIVFGSSPAMQSLRELLEQVAPTNSTVLVRGESGTGKELFARALHRLSSRNDRPFVKIDCTSLPDNLIESELFGYEKGAFTGAATQKPGRVELADTGTLFLDEIGELRPPLQAKLLRLLQDREFERLGGQRTLRVDVRVVAATHRDLEGMVQKGEFRQDLFYRLNVVPLWIAPLRARRADVSPLAQHFCGEVVKANDREPVRLEAEALALLGAQRWPGNARQLQNFVERLVVLCKGASISAEDVKQELERPVRFATETGTAGADAADAEAGAASRLLDHAVQEAERQALVRALDQARGNRSAAARLLGVSRTTLYAKLEEYALL